MKQVKTLKDLEDMQPRERDAWFAERFGYGIRHEIIHDDIKHCAHLKKDGYTVNYPQFTQSNDGNADLKTEMVNLGYKWECRLEDNEYYFAFRKSRNGAYSYGKTEIEATWKAAALVFLGEV